MANVPRPADTDTALARYQAAWLRLSDERAVWQRRELAAEVRGYDRGHADGWRAGRESAFAELAADWSAMAKPASRSGVSFAELERRRYPHGRPVRHCATCGLIHRDGLRSGEAA